MPLLSFLFVHFMAFYIPSYKSLWWHQYNTDDYDDDEFVTNADAAAEADDDYDVVDV